MMARLCSNMKCVRSLVGEAFCYQILPNQNRDRSTVNSVQHPIHRVYNDVGRVSDFPSVEEANMFV